MAGVYNAVWRSLWSLYLDDMSPGQHLAVMATSGDHRGHSTSTWTTCHLANIWQRWRRPEITVVALPGRHVTWSTPGSDGDGRRSLWSLYLDVTSPGQQLAVMAAAGDHCGHSTWTPCHLANTWQWWRRPEWPRWPSSSAVVGLTDIVVNLQTTTRLPPTGHTVSFFIILPVDRVF